MTRDSILQAKAATDLAWLSTWIDDHPSNLESMTALGEHIAALVTRAREWIGTEARP